MRKINKTVQKLKNKKSIKKKIQRGSGTNKINSKKKQNNNVTDSSVKISHEDVSTLKSSELREWRIKYLI